ncbi:glutathione hydrolase 1 proenzyme-like [Myxocyprinus asiaticus]|uniref:glutathione hydrolase 1 proenzyme-like n=1 Tax=Myxocyprinus asiaticus TaxID=70543 RepID=UPI002222A8BF|nr:glutathione hydrolase 1 proenzyme-like [Myxocyprinus asiaticus]
MADRNYRRLICVGISFVFALCLLIWIIIRKTSPIEHSSYACYSKAAVAADNGICSKIGRDILQRGGSAVDAAIAALLCLGVVHPHTMGIGGGVIFNIYDASTENVIIIDARETAPRNANKTMFGNSYQMEKTGNLSIAVPGQIRGLELAHIKFGRLPWKVLFQPSINLARDGFKISKSLSRAIKNKCASNDSKVTLCDAFRDSNKNLLKENDNLNLIKLADTYQKIADEGPNAFYTGSIAKNIEIETGIITREDLEKYKAKEKNTINISVGENTVYVPDAPSGGPVLALILNVLKGYNFSSHSMSTKENKTLTYHRIIEAFRFAYAERTKLGDPQNDNLKPIHDAIQDITSEHFANNIRSKITDTTHPESYYKPESYVPDDKGTSHLSVIAGDGSAVAVTSSINDHFGSLVMSPSTGIIFNNQMDDFTYPCYEKSNGLNNCIKAGKRPLSSMSPTIIFDKHNQVKMVVGASGGKQITTGTAQVILDYLFFNYDLNKSVNEPRVHTELRPDNTSAESDFEESLYKGLNKTHHHKIYLLPLNKTLARVQSVVQQNGEICAKCDDRKGGYPAGY